MKPDQDVRSELEAALSEGQRLREEIGRLKEILARNSIPLPESEKKATAREEFRLRLFAVSPKALGPTVVNFVAVESPGVQQGTTGFNRLRPTPLPASS